MLLLPISAASHTVMKHRCQFQLSNSELKRGADVLSRTLLLKAAFECCWITQLPKTVANRCCGKILLNAAARRICRAVKRGSKSQLSKSIVAVERYKKVIAAVCNAVRKICWQTKVLPNCDAINLSNFSCQGFRMLQ